MTTPASGQITTGDVNSETGRGASAQTGIDWISANTKGSATDYDSYHNKAYYTKNNAGNCDNGNCSTASSSGNIQCVNCTTSTINCTNCDTQAWLQPNCNCACTYNCTQNTDQGYNCNCNCNCDCFICACACW